MRICYSKLMNEIVDARVGISLACETLFTTDVFLGTSGVSVWIPKARICWNHAIRNKTWEFKGLNCDSKLMSLPILILHFFVFEYVQYSWKSWTDVRWLQQQSVDDVRDMAKNDCSVKQFAWFDTLFPLLLLMLVNPGFVVSSYRSILWSMCEKISLKLYSISHLLTKKGGRL